MRIWVDGQCFQTASGIRGIGRYVIELLQSLQASGQVELILSLNGSLPDEAISARRYIERMLPEAEIVVWYSQALYPSISHPTEDGRKTDAHILRHHINGLNVDVALSVSAFEGLSDRASPFLEPQGIEALSACIFYDAIPYRYPNSYLPTKEGKEAYESRLTAVSNFDLVLCISDFTESEYRSLFDKENVTSISSGLSNSFAEILAQNAPNPLGDIGPYVLYVGGADWRKNVPFMVRAMAKIPAAQKGQLKLVLSGGNQEVLIDELNQAWSVAGLPKGNLIMTGWVSDAELATIYREAAMTVQPSFMEGFGLTALEAMAAGSPFLGANASAIPEVVQSEDLLFNPHDPQDLADRIQRMMEDEEFRAKAIAHGYGRTKIFTWQNTAKLTLAALQNALGDRPRAVAPKATEEAPPRLLMDVSSTARSSARTGIQRVIHRLSDSLLALNDQPGYAKTLLTQRHEMTGWSQMERLDKELISNAPFDQMGFGKNDSYFLLDSSWTSLEGQKARLSAALVEGQQVIHGIHDIGPLTAPALADPGMPPAFRAWFEMILGHSTGLICVSRAVADEVHALIEKIELPRPMNIGYCELGADFADVSPDAAWLDFTGGRPTFLMVGTLEPRKGHWVALEAFEKLWAEGLEVNLLIIGKMGWSVKVLSERLKNHPQLEKYLFVRNGISDAELRAAYDHCDALLMSSYLEGFGLPVVEAGALNCPVIVADIPVFREVSLAAPAVRFFEPLNPASLAECVKEVAANGFPDRKDDRAQWPDWDQIAKRVHEIIFDGKWYKRYEPKEAVTPVALSDIGRVHMKGILPKEQLKLAIKRVEGPLLSENGHEITFTLSVRNEGDVILSSHGKRDGNFGIRLGYHVYDRAGTKISGESPRSLIPFVILPGQEVFMPLRVPSDWLYQKGATIGYEWVQEGVKWLGELGRVDLLQPPLKEVPQTFGDASRLHMSLARPIISQGGERFAILMLMNGGDLALPLMDGDGKPLLSVLGLDASAALIDEGEVITCPDYLGASSYALIGLRLPVARRLAEVTLRYKGQGGRDWLLNIARNILFPAGEEPAALPTKSGLAQQRQEIFVDSYSDLADDGFLRAVYRLLIGRSIEPTILRRYSTLMEHGLIGRRGIVELILSDNHLREFWQINGAEVEPKDVVLTLNRFWPRRALMLYLERCFNIRMPAKARQAWNRHRMGHEEFSKIIQAQIEPFYNRITLKTRFGAKMPMPVELGGGGRKKIALYILQGVRNRAKGYASRVKNRFRR